MDQFDRHAQLGQYLLHRVHHRRRSTYEVLHSPKLLGKMPLKNLSVDIPPLSTPVRFRILQNVNDLEIHPAFQRIKLLTQRKALKVLASVKKKNWTLVASIRKRKAS